MKYQRHRRESLTFLAVTALHGSRDGMYAAAVVLLDQRELECRRRRPWSTSLSSTAMNSKDVCYGRKTAGRRDHSDSHEEMKWKRPTDEQEIRKV